MSKKHVIRKYNSLAHFYDERWKGYLEATHRVAIELLDPTPNDVILDASGGTGLLAEQIITKLGNKGQIFIIDISDEMLELAKNRLKQYENITTGLQNVHELDFDHNYFSKIVNVSSFHYYSDPQEVLSNFHRILKRNGVLVLVDWCRDSFHFKILDLFMRLFNKTYIRTYSSKEFRLLVEESKFKIEKVSRFTHGLWSLIGVKAIKL